MTYSRSLTFMRPSEDDGMDDSSLVLRKGAWSTIATCLGVVGDRTRGWSWPVRGSHLLAVLWLGGFLRGFSTSSDSADQLLKDGLFTVFDLHRAK